VTKRAEKGGKTWFLRQNLAFFGQKTTDFAVFVSPCLCLTIVCKLNILSIKLLLIFAYCSLLGMTFSFFDGHPLPATANSWVDSGIAIVPNRASGQRCRAKFHCAPIAINPLQNPVGKGRSLLEALSSTITGTGV
jgi:hypothetical protein